MRILTCVVTHNCTEMLPWFLRHYETFVDDIWAFDDESNDGTRDILKSHPKVKFHKWPYTTGLYEDMMLAFCYETYPQAIGRFDWLVWSDPDEFIYAPDVRGVIAQADDEGYEAIKTRGFNIVGNGMPADDGRSQIYEVLTRGVNAPIYSKSVVFKPTAHMRFIRGKHALENCNPNITPDARLKLLHVRYLGAEHTRKRNAQNYNRLGLLDGDKGPGWSVSPEYDGEHLEGSPKWSEFARTQAFNVMEAAI